MRGGEYPVDEDAFKGQVVCVAEPFGHVVEGGEAVGDGEEFALLVGESAAGEVDGVAVDLDVGDLLDGAGGEDALLGSVGFVGPRAEADGVAGCGSALGCWADGLEFLALFDEGGELRLEHADEGGGFGGVLHAVGSVSVGRRKSRK